MDNEHIQSAIKFLIENIQIQIPEAVNLIKKQKDKRDYIEISAIYGVNKKQLDGLFLGDVVDYVRNKVKYYTYEIEPGFFILSNHMVSYDKAHDEEVFNSLLGLDKDAIHFELRLLIKEEE